MVVNLPHAKELIEDLEEVFHKFLVKKGFHANSRMKEHISFITWFEHVGKQIFTGVKEEGVQFTVEFRGATWYA